MQTLSYQLCDINGKLIEKKKISSNETIISSINLVSGVYFLKVIDKNKEIKTFKIIKNH
ncbi:MAG: T9SS type A sorting domain-containing protein [Saprospiraceae bacterium]|nr:T9SS type A sorting domain-containing protein [Saprospiraceae bacterium]